MQLERSYTHPHRLWGVHGLEIFTEQSEAVQAASDWENDGEYPQPAGVFFLQDYYPGHEHGVWAVAHGAWYFNLARTHEPVT